LQNEFEEMIEFNSEHLREGSAADFLTKLKNLIIYDKIKADQNQITCCDTLGSYAEICKTKFGSKISFRTFGYTALGGLKF
jgi:hypothetical protein